MKKSTETKNVKKLELSAETLRKLQNLDDVKLKNAVGGVVADTEGLDCVK